MTIENTSKRDPLVHVVGAISDGTSDYITGMEAAGQRQVVASTKLPTEVIWCSEQDLIDLGFTFGEPDAHDPLFREATLPEGWSKKGSDHDMWSYVVDERGIERVSVFYKAAYYDRRAHMGISNVGHGLASKALYDETVAIPWEVLTDAERADAVSSIRDTLAKAEKHPTIYGDKVARAEALLAEQSDTP